MWQISFAANPKVVEDLRQQLKLDERVIRHIFVKKDIFKPLPTTSAVKQRATNVLKGGTSSKQQVENHSNKHPCRSKSWYPLHGLVSLLAKW